MAGCSGSLAYYGRASPAIGAIFSLRRTESSWINVLLAVHWIWSGLVYHGMFFARVNPAARLFAILFFTEGCLFLWFGFSKNRLRYRTAVSDVWTILGASLALYAMAYKALAV